MRCLRNLFFFFKKSKPCYCLYVWTPVKWSISMRVLSTMRVGCNFLSTPRLLCQPELSHQSTKIILHPKHSSYTPVIAFGHYTLHVHCTHLYCALYKDIRHLWDQIQNNNSISCTALKVFNFLLLLVGGRYIWAKLQGQVHEANLLPHEAIRDNELLC